MHAFGRFFFSSIVIITCTQCTLYYNDWKVMHSWLFLIGMCSFAIFIFSHAARIRMYIIRFDFRWNARNGLINSFGMFTATPVFRQLKYTTTLKVSTSKPYWQFFADANKQCTKPNQIENIYVSLLVALCYIFKSVLVAGSGTFYDFNVCTGSVFS